MKNWLFVLLFLPLSVYARKQDKVSLLSLHSTHENVIVESVRFSDDYTFVSISYASTPNSWFKISRSIYASDEAGVRHQVIGAEGIELDEEQWIGDNGQTTFTLMFDPLPKGTKVFDIIEGEDPVNFKIFGIHKKGAKLRLPEIDEAVDSAETAERWFVPDTAVVRVRITGYDRQTMPHIARLEYNNSQELQDTHRLEKLSQIHADGSFEYSFLLDYPKMTRLSLDLRRDIQFYIRPGDTLNIQVDNYGQWNEKITYNNNAGRPTYPDLQEIPNNLFWQEFIYVQSSKSIASFTERLQELYATASELFKYLSWRHKLSSWENHLLMNNFRLRREEAYQRSRAQRQYEINELRQKQGHKESGIDNEMLPIKSEIDWSDMSLLYCNRWQASLVPESSALRKFAKPQAMSNPGSERYPTYRVTNVRAQEFIDSITSRSDARYTELFLTTPDQREWKLKYLERFIDVAADFEGPDFHFVLVVSRGFDDSELDHFKFQLQQECKMYVADVDVVYIGVEDMVNLQEALHDYILPGNTTITREGDVFCRPMYTYGDQSRLFLRELLKHDRENAKNRE